MRAGTRTLLFVSIIIVFVVIAPLLVLYAKGYSFEPKSGEVVRTGMILIDTNVSKVTVTLNQDKPHVENDPVILRSLVPGEYHVTLEREGYQSWQATLTVTAERVTRVDDVILALSEPEIEQPITDPVGLFAVSPNSRFITYVVTQGPDAGLWMHTNGDEDNRQLIDPQDATPLGSSSPDLSLDSLAELRWSQNSRMLLLRDTDNNYWRIAPHVTVPDVVALPELAGVSPEEIQLDQDEPTTVYYRDGKADVYRLRSGRTEAFPELLARESLAFSAYNPKVFVLKQGSTGTLELHSFDVREAPPTDVTVATLTGSNGSLITGSSTRVAALADEALLMLKRLDGEFVFTKIAQGVTRAEWSEDGALLLYTIDDELWIHDLDPLEHEAEQYSVGTISGEYSDIFWHPDGRHVVILSQDQDRTRVNVVHASRTAPQTQTIAKILASQPPQFARGGADLVYPVVKPTPGLILHTITEELD